MTDTEILAASNNPVYAERDLHDYPYGHGARPCPFGFAHVDPEPGADEVSWRDEAAKATPEYYGLVSESEARALDGNR